jgi:hypothetical protein
MYLFRSHRRRVFPSEPLLRKRTKRKVTGPARASEENTTMTTNRLAVLTCLALALSAPAMAYTGSDNYYGNSAQSGSQSGSGKGADDNGGHGNESGDDHGKDNQPGDDHGNDNQTPAFQQTDVRLATSAAGAAFGASGNVDIRAGGNNQRVKVEIEGNFADGTQFQVVANGLAIGSITARLQHGELELELENGAALPGGLVPSTINAIEVRDLSGNALLTGRFAAIGGAPAPAPAIGFTKTEKALQAVAAAATSVGAAGTAELRVQGAQQEFHLKVDAAVADGTTWQVLVNGISAGTLKFRLHAAEFKLQSGDPLPAGVTSIAAIATVAVTDGTTTLLSASLK